MSADDSLVLEILKVIQRDISGLKSDVADLKSDVATIKADILDMKAGIGRWLERRVDFIDGRVEDSFRLLRTFWETETSHERRLARAEQRLTALEQRVPPTS